jgi:hypothetical protein
VYNWLINDPIGLILLALIRNVIYLIVGMFVLIGMMEMLFTYMNKSIGISFKEHVWNVIKDDPDACALYFGIRVAGALIASGLIASAFLK